MRTAGIIAEYNPFHNGHAYQLGEVRRRTKADYIVIAMSGDFLQRGLPAIADKHTRTEMALRAGADLVLELPAVFACASAERFASGGIAVLGTTGVVDTVCYGVESPGAGMRKTLAETLVRPPADFEARIASLVKRGHTYPQARALALAEEFPQYSKGELDTIASPNNLLALEYEKAICLWNQTAQKPLRSLEIPRVGDRYHDESIHTRYASATAIRRRLTGTAYGFSSREDDGDGTVPSADGANAASHASSSREDANAADLAAVLPAHCLMRLEELAAQRRLLCADDFSEALYIRLLSLRKEDCCAYADCSMALSGRIREHLGEYLSFTQFASLLKTKELTRTRIDRVLAHILLGITKEDCACSTIPYLRVLGFTRRAEPLLSEIDKKASAPLLTKVADAARMLPESARHMLHKDICAADLYRGVSQIKSKRLLCNEFNTPLVIL